MSAESSQVFDLCEAVAYQEGSVVSRTLVKKQAGTLTLFAFDADQSLSEHSAPFDATVMILDGKACITIAGNKHELGPGQCMVMPANIPHAVQALSRFKMMLVMIKSST